MARRNFRTRNRPRSNRSGWRGFTPILIILPLATFTAVFLFGLPPLANAVPSRSADREAGRFALCNGPERTTCVIDGDTFWYRGEKIRVADINAPEVSQPDCAAEAALGRRATQRLQALLNQGAFTLEPIDRERDRYGRLLRTVTRSGESLGSVLVSEGLAEEWQGYRRNWCGLARS